METFGIWNLLKSLLASEGPPISTPEKGKENSVGASVGVSVGASAAGTESPASSAKDGGERPTSPEASFEKSNACEEYLLRHERLTHGRKR